MNNTTQQTSITINGRTFSITTQQTAQGTQYVLQGKRGATYGTMRKHNNPSVMFLVDGRGFGIPAGFGNVWLTDKNGTLEVVR